MASPTTIGGIEMSREKRPRGPYPVLQPLPAKSIVPERIPRYHHNDRVLGIATPMLGGQHALGSGRADCTGLWQ